MQDQQNQSNRLREQAVDVLRRARRLPVGSHRNDLRQLAIGLRSLDVLQPKGDSSTIRSMPTTRETAAQLTV